MIIPVMMEYLSHSVEETFAVGQTFGRSLTPNAVVCFLGDLGAGKTSMIKGVAAGAGQIPPEAVNSPTFVYLNIYQGMQTIYHFDLYRLSDTDQFLSMGFDDYFFAGGICCIEWPERIAPILPSHAIYVTLTHEGEDTRNIQIKIGNE